MKASLAALLLAFALPCAASSVDVPIYPGAKLNAMLTQAQHDQNAENEAYTTGDSFETVSEYYRKLGAENLKSKVIGPDYKAVQFLFKGNKFNVVISWVPRSNLGTMITFQRKSE